MLSTLKKPEFYVSLKALGTLVFFGSLTAVNLSSLFFIFLNDARYEQELDQIFVIVVIMVALSKLKIEPTLFKVIWFFFQFILCLYIQVA